MVHKPCAIASSMNSSVCIVRNSTTTRFGWGVEGVVR